MASRNEHVQVKSGRRRERRQRRSGCLSDALRLQLEACRQDGGLDAIVVSDELGFCVAHAGGDGRHGELAARLPLLLAPVQAPLVNDGEVGEIGEIGDDDEDGLHPPRGALVISTFSIAGARLHACAVKRPDAPAETSTGDAAILARVATAFTRLLAQ